MWSKAKAMLVVLWYAFQGAQSGDAYEGYTRCLPIVFANSVWKTTEIGRMARKGTLSHVTGSPSVQTFLCLGRRASWDPEQDWRSNILRSAVQWAFVTAKYALDEAKRLEKEQMVIQRKSNGCTLCKRRFEQRHFPACKKKITADMDAIVQRCGSM